MNCLSLLVWIICYFRCVAVMFFLLLVICMSLSHTVVFL
jgi:hypothetical protein